MRRRSRGNAERGQALVELSLVVIVMMFLLVGALDLGRVFYGKIAVTDAAKEGALVASQGGFYDPDAPDASCDPSGKSIRCAAAGEVVGGFVQVLPENVTATGTCPKDADDKTPPVEVRVEAPFHAITPIVAAVLGGSDVMLSATATAQCRYVPQPSLNPVPPSPFPSPTVSPSPVPSPSPLCLVVPDLKVAVGGGTETVDQARAEWQAAGFTGPFSPSSGHVNKNVVTQNPSAGGLCRPATTPMSVTWS